MTIIIVGILCLIFPWAIPGVVGFMLGGIWGIAGAYLAIICCVIALGVITNL